MENVMIRDVAFEEGVKGGVRIVGEMEPKLIAFGMAQRTPIVSESAASTAMTWVRPYHGPEASLLPTDSESAADRAFSWMASDVWALGVIFFECVVGAPIYKTWRDSEDGGCLAVFASSWTKSQIRRGNLAQYLAEYKLTHCFDDGALSLLLGLLDIEPKRRLTAGSAAKHSWFQ